MQCRQCGTEISDKALICFRCGAATSEPKTAPPGQAAGGLSLIPSLLIWVALVLAALFIGRAGAGETTSVVAWVIVALVACAIVWRRVSRR